MKVAVIGGGASGMVCAIAIKQQNSEAAVTVFEKLPRTLKKILVTGNGRCNLTNLKSVPQCYRGDIELVREVFRSFSPQSNIDFFKDMGLLTFCEAQGRVYPMSCSANSVVNALLNEAQRLGVEIVTDTEVKTLEKKDDEFIINGKYKADKVVISCGGSAAKSQGTDGSSYRLLKAMGVKIREPKPALTGVTVKDFPASLKGVRRVSNVRLFVDGNEIFTETGEVQYNDYGVSGIPVMQLSSLVSTSKSSNIKLRIDSLPSLDKKYLQDFLLEQKSKTPSLSAEAFVSGLLPKPLAAYILKLAKLVSLLKEFELEVSGVRGFENAQTTAGGVVADELNAQTLELKKIKGLYVTGEAVNVDGLCGGHNLQWAWASGRQAARAIAKGF